MWKLCRGYLEVVQLLLEARAPKNTQLSVGATAILIAAERGHCKVVRGLRLELTGTRQREVGQHLCMLHLIMANWQLCGCC